MDANNDDDIKIGKIIMQCALDIRIGLNAYQENLLVKVSLNILLAKFGDSGDQFFFTELLNDEIIGLSVDENHKRKGWNRKLFMKWATIMQDLDRNNENDIYKIEAIRDRLYFFFKPEYFTS